MILEELEETRNLVPSKGGGRGVFESDWRLGFTMTVWFSGAFGEVLKETSIFAASVASKDDVCWDSILDSFELCEQSFKISRVKDWVGRVAWLEMLALIRLFDLLVAEIEVEFEVEELSLEKADEDEDEDQLIFELGLLIKDDVEHFRAIFEFCFMLKCLEQNPLLWDSLEQSSLEHNLRHCLPLNFFLIPFAAETISPFLYLFELVKPPFVDVEAAIDDDEEQKGKELEHEEFGSDEEGISWRVFGAEVMVGRNRLPLLLIKVLEVAAAEFTELVIT